MGKCPNCGRETARTEDWACQWCGYPLLSGSYKKISKTFKQLKEEEPHEPESSAGDAESEVSVLPQHIPLVPTRTAEPEPISEPEQVLESEPEPEQVPEPEPEFIPAAKEITVEQLISAYEVDEVATDTEFVGKILKLTGVVTKIEVNDTLDVHYIVLTSAEKKGPQSVRCIFSKQHGAQLNQLTKEQMVTVQGKYNGSIITMRMRDCVLGH